MTSLGAGWARCKAANTQSLVSLVRAGCYPRNPDAWAYFGSDGQCLPVPNVVGASVLRCCKSQRIAAPTRIFHRHSYARTVKAAQVHLKGLRASRCRIADRSHRSRDVSVEMAIIRSTGVCRRKSKIRARISSRRAPSAGTKHKLIRADGFAFASATPAGPTSASPRTA